MTTALDEAAAIRCTAEEQVSVHDDIEHLKDLRNQGPQ